MARRKTNKEVLTQRVRYPEDGQMEELRGGYFDVPSSVTDKAGWLESQYREEMAKAVAQKEKEAREQKVLSDRIEKQREVDSRLPSRVDDLEAENQQLRLKVERLEDQIATPDAQEQLKVNQQTSQLMGTTYEMGQTVLNQTEQTRQLQETNAEGIQQWNDLRQQTLDVESNRLDFWNKAQQSASERIQQEEAERVKWNAEAMKWKALYENGAKTIAAANKITAASVERQEQLLQAKADQLEADFVEMVNFIITSLGLTEDTLNLTANSVDMGTKNAVRLSYRQIQFFAEVMREERPQEGQQ